MNTRFSLKHLKLDTVFQITEHSSIIGRSENCDFQLDKETLSREHARLSVKTDHIFIEDLHSTNGTFVNERQIFESTALSPGDVIRFGQEAFSLEDKIEDATIMFDPRSLSQSDSAMLVEDDEEEDGTVMLQSISLPQGWEKGAFSDEDTPSKKGSDDELLQALKKHARAKLKHKHGLLLSIIQENRVPVVKLLSSSEIAAQWRVGRGEQSDIRLDDARVSETHATLKLNEGQWLVVDADSRNGTFKGNLKVSELALKETETINIGPYTISLEALEHR